MIVRPLVRTALAVSEVYERNRRASDASSDAYQARHGAQLAAAPLAWYIWSVPESELRMLRDVAGLDVLAYGCGAAQWAIGLARLGARVSRLDDSERQPAYARSSVANVRRPISAYVELVVINGFVVERVLEPRPLGASSSDDMAPLAWARSFPAELIVRARRR